MWWSSKTYNLLLANVKKLQHRTQLEFVKIIDIRVDEKNFFPSPNNGEKYLKCDDFQDNPAALELIYRVRLKIAEMWYSWVTRDPEFIKYLSNCDPCVARGIFVQELDILHNAKNIISENQEMTKKYKELLAKIEANIATIKEEIAKKNIEINQTQKRGEHLQQELNKHLQKLSTNF